MRIQSIQNQPMQNRPNFSANLRIKKLPDLLGGVWVGSSHLHLKDDSPRVVDVLNHLLSRGFKDFVGIDGPKVSADGANLRHFVSPSGDRVVLNKSLYEGDNGRPIGLVFKPVDGSEIWLTRDDINFIDEPPTPTDVLFDKAAAVLDAKKATTELLSFEQRMADAEFFTE